MGTTLVPTKLRIDVTFFPILGDKYHLGTNLVQTKGVRVSDGQEGREKNWLIFIRCRIHPPIPSKGKGNTLKYKTMFLLFC